LLEDCALGAAVVVVAAKENVLAVEVVTAKVVCVAIYAVGRWILKEGDGLDAHLYDGEKNSVKKPNSSLT